MNNFNIDEEIDATIDKFAEQLKFKLKKMVERSEKQVLKQYINSQKKYVGKSTRDTACAIPPPQRDTKSREKYTTTKQQKVSKNPPKREADYSSGSSGSSDSSSD